MNRRKSNSGLFVALAAGLIGFSAPMAVHAAEITLTYAFVWSITAAKATTTVG